MRQKLEKKENDLTNSVIENKYRSRKKKMLIYTQQEQNCYNQTNSSIMINIKHNPMIMKI